MGHIPDEVTLKCKQEFTEDQTLVLYAYKQMPNGTTEQVITGKLQVWANDASKQKEKKVVFV